MGQYLGHSFPELHIFSQRPITHHSAYVVWSGDSELSVFFLEIQLRCMQIDPINAFQSVRILYWHMLKNAFLEILKYFGPFNLPASEFK